MKEQESGENMQLETLISPSGNLVYIDRFDDIVDMASAMKGQVFIADASTNKLYGFFLECYSVMEAVIPFPIQNSVMFYSMNSDERQIVRDNPTIFYYTERPEFLISINRRGDFENQNIGYDHDTGNFYDLMTGAEIRDCLSICRSSRVFINWMFPDTLARFKNREAFLGPPIVFENMQTNQIIQSTLSDKVSAGIKKLILPIGDHNLCICIFRNTFPQLNKSDRLDIIVRKDLLEGNSYVVNFKVYKSFKKCKLPFALPDGIIYQNHMRFLDIV